LTFVDKVYIFSGYPSDVLKLSIFLVVSAKKIRDWETLANFLTNFTGRCSLLDLHGLYALSRVSNLEELRRVLSVASLQHSDITDLAMTIELESYCHRDSVTFTTHLRDAVDTACVGD
jgi:hypothetical protein